METEGNRQKIRVGLVQANNSYSGQNYLPLSVAMLQAYAQRYLQQPDDYQFSIPIYRRSPVGEAVEKLVGVQIAFFSTYVWNTQISLEIARRLKVVAPDTVIVIGGPQVPNQAEAFLRKYSFIDVACHGEGEQTSLAILENCLSKEWVHIPGVSFLTHGTFVQNPKPPRLSDLSLAPSPFLEGVFAPLMEANPREHWIACWETNRGCPFSCTFCDWGSAVQSKVFSFDMERLYQEIQWFADNKIDFVLCCDANFGILSRDLDIAQCLAETKLKYGYPGTVSLQNTKNATERAYQAQKILADAGLSNGVDLALQSMDINTLESIKRANISLETYQELQRKFTRDGVETHTDLIIGLPGETYASFADGVSTIIENGQHNRIQFPILAILPNAEMGDPEYQKKFGMITVESSIIAGHGSLTEPGDDVIETQVLVVGTNAMPKEDWVRTMVFTWMAGLLHFDKLLQIPFILIHEVCSVSYRDLIQEFCEGPLDSFPVIDDIRSFFLDRARIIQEGGPEFTPSKEWLNVWWPPDEYMFIELSASAKLDQFYEEAERILSRLLQERCLPIADGLLHQTMELNRRLLKQPFQTEDADLDFNYNIWEFYRSTLKGQNTPLESKVSKYHIDRTATKWSSWDDWCREVVWYGNKRGAYFYGNDSVVPLLAGHH